jgi:hypothetical protein
MRVRRQLLQHTGKIGNLDPVARGYQFPQKQRLRFRTAIIASRRTTGRES